MSDINQNRAPNHNQNNDWNFGEEISMTQCGFTFQPILNLELEIDESVYMYSDDGNLEISLLGGALEDNASIAEMNDLLAADVLGNVDSFELVEAGTDTIQKVQGFLNEVYYVNAGEDGIGRALICSPYLNQYFFMIVIASVDFWREQGHAIFDLLKSKIQFHPQFLADENQEDITSFSDLRTEIFEASNPEEDFLLTVEKGEISFLLAARAFSEDDIITITRIAAPNGKQLYSYDPTTGDFSSTICEKPLIGHQGEVDFFFPRDNQNTLTPGEFCFSFETQPQTGLQEIQIIRRIGRALAVQALDINLWLAVDNNRFYDQAYLNQLRSALSEVLEEKMMPFNLKPGEITFFIPAMDELEAFSTININTDLPDCSYMISENVNNSRALNIGLVEKIITDNSEVAKHIKAISSGSPGMILSSASPHSCILLEWPVFQDDLDSLANTILEQLIIFSGIDTRGTQTHETQGLQLNHEIAWRIRRHPLFHNAD